MISYSGGPNYLYLNWFKNYELLNTLIRCKTVDFPYICMESAVFPTRSKIFNTKQLFFVKSRSDLFEAISIATLLSWILTIKFKNSRTFSMEVIREYTRMYKPQQLSTPFDRALLYILDKRRGMYFRFYVPVGRFFTSLSIQNSPVNKKWYMYIDCI